MHLVFPKIWLAQCHSSRTAATINGTSPSSMTLSVFWRVHRFLKSWEKVPTEVGIKYTQALQHDAAAQSVTAAKISIYLEANWVPNELPLTSLSPALLLGSPFTSTLPPRVGISSSFITDHLCTLSAMLYGPGFSSAARSTAVVAPVPSGPEDWCQL